MEYPYVLICNTDLSLSDFTLYNRLWVHPPHQNWLKCVPLYGWVIFHCVYVPHFFIHSSISGRLGCFHVLAVGNSAAMSNGMHVSFSVLVSSGYMPRTHWILKAILSTSLIFKLISMLILEFPNLHTILCISLFTNVCHHLPIEDIVYESTDGSL